jgi:hypothetical protein
MSIELKNNYNVDSTVHSESKRITVYQSDDETTRFDRELMKKAKTPRSFATPITEEELFRQWDETVKANQDKK